MSGYLLRRREFIEAHATGASLAVVHCDRKFFKASVRHARTGSEPARLCRERWHRRTARAMNVLRCDVEWMRRLGIGAIGENLAMATSDRMDEARIAWAESRGLSPMLAALIEFPGESGLVPDRAGKPQRRSPTRACDLEAKRPAGEGQAEA